jgi:hypothetical protein
MPIELQIIRASDFVRLDADEQLNFEESKKVLQDLARACRKRGLDHAMLDLRELPVPDKPRFTDAELAAAVNAFREAGFSSRQRLAILYRQDVYGKLRNFTLFSRMRGLNVQAFHEFEEAMQWLWEGAENLEQEHGIGVPIFQRAAKRTMHVADGIHSAAAPRPVRRLKRSHR